MNKLIIELKKEVENNNNEYVKFLISEEIEKIKKDYNIQ